MYKKKGLYSTIWMLGNHFSLTKCKQIFDEDFHDKWYIFHRILKIIIENVYHWRQSDCYTIKKNKYRKTNVIYVGLHFINSNRKHFCSQTYKNQLNVFRLEISWVIVIHSHFHLFYLRSKIISKALRQLKLSFFFSPKMITIRLNISYKSREYWSTIRRRFRYKNDISRPPKTLNMLFFILLRQSSYPKNIYWTSSL